MGNRLFVGGLPFAMTDAELNDLFASHGTVTSAKVMVDKFSGRSRGFGFVEMSTADEANAAIQALNGSEVGGRQIVVNEARPMTDRPERPRGGNGGGFGGGNGGGYGQRRDRY